MLGLPSEHGRKLDASPGAAFRAIEREVFRTAREISAPDAIPLVSRAAGTDTVSIASMKYAEPAEVILQLLVAALGGLAVGIEREWSARKEHAAPRFAGVRTFLLLGLIGGLSAELARTGFPAAAAVLLAGAAGLAVAAYVVKGRKEADGTTEVAALFVLGAGFLAGSGRLVLASGLFAVGAFVLVEKSRFHGAVFKIRSEELEAGARFAVLALVVLPLLPEGPFGPEPGVRPRELWALALLFSSISFAGLVAIRVAGPNRGPGLAGLLGGLVSSTAVTLQLSRESRLQPRLGRALALGVVAASSVLLLRVVAILLILAPALAARVAPLLAPPFVVGVAACAVLYREKTGDEPEIEPPKNPLRFVAAITMAVLFQVVLYAMSWVKGAFGSPGLVLSGALLGFTDMDALTYSMVKLGGSGDLLSVAARALAAGVLSNTVLKLALALAFGRGSFRFTAAAGLAALGAASALALLIL